VDYSSYHKHIKDIEIDCHCIFYIACMNI
jgi:hypothetical protein